MKWINTLRGFLVDTALDATASTMNVAGSLACMAGGAGFALTYSINESLNAAYYSDANTYGAFNLSLSIHQMNLSANASIPFTHYKQVDGMDNLSEYIDPDTILSASITLSAMGIFLRGLAANLNKWRSSEVEEREYEQKYALRIQKPSLEEYAYVNAQSVTGSLSQIMLSNALMGALIYKSGIVGSQYSVTYPLKAEYHVHTINYKGPIKFELVPFYFESMSNISIDLSTSNEADSKEDPVLIENKMSTSAMTNFSYGGGLFFRTPNPDSYVMVLPTLLSAGFFCASSFFSKKVAGEHQERMIQASMTKYVPV